jgi:trk system potassium uptake protein TrkH
LPAETIAKAVAIMTVSTLLVAGVTLTLALTRQGDIFREGFEVVSAFSNTGYSLAFTSELDTFGRLLIAFTMFWGRLGPLTIVVALAESEQPSLVHYPEEPVILG